ncbi:MAG: transposase [Lachnospiraceae bacterium]|nr:transposase [Lachnospiraceae bacterium]
MPRKPRQHSQINIYHVVVKGINSQLLFEEHKDYLKYLEILEFHKENCNFNLFAYCLMSNHIHLLIQVNDTPLESIFKKINTAYAIWFNMKYHRSGPLQDGRYYSEPINSLDYLLSAMRYIHKNPFKANLEKNVGSKYPWSSYHSYIKEKDGLVDINLVLSELGSLDNFIKFHIYDSCCSFIDINNIKRRIPDDVAMEIIKQKCKVVHPTDVCKLSLSERRNAIFLLYENGISARQINRLTGIPRGIVDRILSNKL